MDYKYYITVPSGGYYFVDRFNAVNVGSAPIALTNTPKGWESLLCGLEKSSKYKGSFTKVSTPLNFVGDGKIIIDYIFLTQGSNGAASLIIETKDKPNLTFDILFNGKLDFQQCQLLESTTSINIRENDLLNILESKEDVIYEIELDVTNSVDVQLDGVDLLYGTDFRVVGEAYNDNSIVVLDEVSSENPNTSPTTLYNYGAFPASVPASNMPFYTAKEAASIVFNYDFRASGNWNLAGIPPPPDPLSAFSFSILIEYAAGGYLDTVIYTVAGVVAVYANHHITGTNTLTVSPGDKIYLCLNMNPIVDRLFVVVNYDPTLSSEFTLKSSLRQNPTKHKGIRPVKLWDELIKKASVNEFAGVSTFLNNSDYVLIPGSALRKDTTITIKTSIKDFLKYCYVNHLAVLNADENNEASIGSYLDCFDYDNELTNLGTVANLELVPYLESQFASIKVGYENIELGVNIVNGKDEFNQTNNFTTGYVGLKNEYDIVSPYIASMYAIEALRVKFAQEKTTDSNLDNKVYLLDAVLGGGEFIYNGPFTVTAGNVINIPTTLLTIANGTAITISGGSAVDGGYITSGFAVVLGVSQITVTTAITIGTYAVGIFSIFNATLYVPNREAYVSITGLLSPTTAYNIELSPKRMLILHSPIIGSGIFNYLTISALNTVKFQSGDKNTLLSTDDGTTVISENTDLQIADYVNDMVFNPFLVNFETDYDVSLYKKFYLANKYKYISFIWNDVVFKGFVNSLQIDNSSGKKMKFSLILEKGTDLIKFSKHG